MISYKLNKEHILIKFIYKGRTVSLSVNAKLITQEKVALISGCIDSINRRLGKKATPINVAGKTLYLDVVYLSETEHAKLVDALGSKKLNACIEILNNYKMSNGKQYKSDYHAILNWVIKRADNDIYPQIIRKKQTSKEEFDEIIKNEKRL